MKIITFFACLSIAGLVQAAPPTDAQKALLASRVQACNGVMGKEVCRVQIDGWADCTDEACRMRVFAKRFPNGYKVFGPDGGAFTSDEYFHYVNAGDSMCDVFKRECLLDWDSRACKMGRALWPYSGTAGH